MMQLTFIKWMYISLHACLIFCIWSLIQLYSVILFYNMFKWTCSELVYVSVFKVSMLTLLNAFATWYRIWFWSVFNLHSLLNNSSFLFYYCWVYLSYFCKDSFSCKDFKMTKCQHSYDVIHLYLSKMHTSLQFYIQLHL